LNVHRGPTIDGWAAAHPGRVQFHFLPYHASWLSQIEIWFSILERRCLRRGDFPNHEALEHAIRAFVDTYNRLSCPPLQMDLYRRPARRVVGHELPPASTSSRRAQRGQEGWRVTFVGLGAGLAGAAASGVTVPTAGRAAVAIEGETGCATPL